MSTMECPSMLDIDLCSSSLFAILVALAALNGEVTANLSDREIEAAKSGLIFEALKRGRKLRKFFED
jgi:hypothetical protein